MDADGGASEAYGMEFYDISIRSGRLRRAVVGKCVIPSINRYRAN